MNWTESIRSFLHPRVITMLFLGFSAGIPILLIFSSLSLWLGEAGLKKSAVTMFSWAALGYSFKFIWAPLIDQLPIPWLTRSLGRRRSWMLVSQLMVVVAILLMASIDPQLGVQQLKWMAMAAVLLGFSSATQDIVIDAYRIESAHSELQALMSSTYIAGYRLAMIVAGAGSLFIASYLGTSKETYLYSAWQITYGIMAAMMLVGIVTTLIISEPGPRDDAEHDKNSQRNKSFSVNDNLRLLLLFILVVSSFIMTFFLKPDLVTALKTELINITDNKTLAGFITQTLRLGFGLGVATITGIILIHLGIARKEIAIHSYIDPVSDFFGRYGKKTALLLLLLIGTYRISDIVLGVISNLFYQDMGFNKKEIATAVKTFGVIMAISGGLLGGLLSLRYGVLKILFLGAFLSAATNLLFLLLATHGHDLSLLYLVIAADNLSGGVASAAFIAFLSSLTNISFTAVQYAIFSSLMTMFPKILGGYSGSIVESIGYHGFFITTTLLGLPVLLLIWYASRLYNTEEQS